MKRLVILLMAGVVLVGVAASSTAAGTGSLFGVGLPHVFVSDLYVAPDGGLVRAATYGRGVWEASLR